MEYIRVEENGQLVLEETSRNLQIPSCLYGFRNTMTTAAKAKSGRNVFCFQGELDADEGDRLCPLCGCRMHVNNRMTATLRHLCFGSNLSCVTFPRCQYKCPKCGTTKMQFIPFKAARHRMTEELYQYARDLLALGTYTNKQVAEITGLGKNTVKDIDMKRLEELYTIDGKLKKPDKTTTVLGIDEFKLHNGRKYATHIIDMETGHILWIANGKKKQVVYDFIEHVGLEWMDSVVAVACDMNSDFQEAFEERCPHIQPVFDYFHLVKNFNDKVVSEIRKDEQRRLMESGDEEAAKSLKRTRYILMSKRSTLEQKDLEAEAGRVIHKGSRIFGTNDVVRKGGNVAKYEALLAENELLFTVDLIKEKLTDAYSMTDESQMAKAIIDIMDICEASGNNRLMWFHHLLDTHFEGIIAHASFQVSSGKVEGINQKIKTLRRHGYGYPDDDYFFLKLFDASRQSYDHNPKSHKICD